MIRIKRARGVARLLAGMIVLGLVLATAPLGVRAATKWTVIAGGADKAMSVVANGFFPRAVEVAVGDTVAWQFEGFHQVAFLSGGPMPPIEVKEGDKFYLNPQVFLPAGGSSYDGTGFRNSGLPLEPGKPFSYSLTFTKAGRYPYVCIIHGPGMGGVVTVKDRAVETPAAALKRGRAEQAATIAAGDAAFKKLKPEKKGNTVVVPMVGDLEKRYSIFRFTREPLVVARGTTVTWDMRDRFEIHTVTFTSGEKPVDFIVQEPQTGGPPKLLLHPKALTPTMPKTYDGKAYVNSGLLYPPGVPGNPPTSFSLTFTRSGRYEYWCLVHVVEGMKGTIVVK